MSQSRHQSKHQVGGITWWVWWLGPLPDACELAAKYARSLAARICWILGCRSSVLTTRPALQEAKRFDGIDKSWKKIMQDTAKNPNVLEACSVEGRLDNLRMLSEQLETCQKSLSEYLDTKRCAFPRYVNLKDSLRQAKRL